MAGVTAERRIAWLIKFVSAPNGCFWWTQNANSQGLAICDGCLLTSSSWEETRPVVYSSFLQWCESCWPMAAPHDQSTQAKDWATKREGQERDYGWRLREPDWTERLTEEERELVRLWEMADADYYGRTDVVRFAHTVAALRVLAEELKGALVCSYAMRGSDPCYRSGGTPCVPCRVRALTEDGIRKRLEE